LPVPETILLDFTCPVNANGKDAFQILFQNTCSHVVGIDYQILIETDFPVILQEDEASQNDIKHAYDRIFATDAGRKICREMYGIP